MVDIDFKLEQQMKMMNIEYEYDKNIFKIRNLNINERNVKKYDDLLELIYKFCEHKDINWIDVNAIKSQKNIDVKQFLKQHNFSTLINKYNSICMRKQIK